MSSKKKKQKRKVTWSEEDEISSFIPLLRNRIFNSIKLYFMPFNNIGTSSGTY